MPNYEALRNYKPIAEYSNPRSKLLDMIIKKGYARYEAEAYLQGLLIFHGDDLKTIAHAIVDLKSKKGTR